MTSSLVFRTIRIFRQYVLGYCCMGRNESSEFIRNYRSGIAQKRINPKLLCSLDTNSNIYFNC